MVPDYYTRNKMAIEHRQQLHREAEHERMQAELPEHSSHRMRHIAGKLGMFLIGLGTRLKQLEHPRKHMAYR